MSHALLSLEDVKEIRVRMKASFWARKLWFARNLPDFKVNRLGSLSYISSSPVIEAANIVDGVPDSAGDVERITSHYQLHHAPAQWWMPTDVTSPAAWWLADAGWSIDNVFIGMAISPALSDKIWPDDEASPHLDIKPCDCLERTGDLGLVRGSVYMKENPKDGNLVFKVYQKAGEAIIRGEGGFRAWVCYVDGAAAASVSTLTQRGAAPQSRETVGIYDLTTHPAHQNQGYDRACIMHALKTARNADLVVLQASSKERVSFYASLGFVPVTQFVLWSNRTTL